jgi:hypothetical protein
MGIERSFIFPYTADVGLDQAHLAVLFKESANLLISLMNLSHAH